MFALSSATRPGIRHCRSLGVWVEGGEMQGYVGGGCRQGVLSKGRAQKAAHRFTSFSLFLTAIFSKVDFSQLPATPA